MSNISRRKELDAKRQAFYSRQRKTKVRRARDIQIGDPIGKLVWLVICDHAGNKDGGICNAKLDSIVHETELARSTVCEWIAEFKRQGRMTPQRNGRCVEYIVRIPQGEASALRTEQVRNTDEQVRNTDPKVRNTDLPGTKDGAETPMESAFSNGAEKSKASKAFKKERESAPPSARSLKVIDGEKDKASKVPASKWQPSDDTIKRSKALRPDLSEAQICAVVTKIKDTHPDDDKRYCKAWNAKLLGWIKIEDVSKSSATATAPTNQPEPYTPEYAADWYKKIGYPVLEYTPEWDAQIKAGHNSNLITDLRDPATGLMLGDGWWFKTLLVSEYPDQKAA